MCAVWVCLLFAPLTYSPEPGTHLARSLHIGICDTSGIEALREQRRFALPIGARAIRQASASRANVGDEHVA